MTGFEGFPRQSDTSVSVPDVFFTRLVPQIRSLVELKVTLHLMWVLSQRVGRPRCIEYAELAGDAELLRTLKIADGPRPGEDYLREGLELAVTRGTALQVQLERDPRPEVWYFLNTSASREAVEQLQAGEYEVVAGAIGHSPIRTVRVYRPNIFALYEQNIGPLTPIMADRLRAAETQYPVSWLEEAVRMAVEYNRRSWRYVEAILQRWQAEGKDEGLERSGSDGDGDTFSYFRSKYQHIYR